MFSQHRFYLTHDLDSDWKARSGRYMSNNDSIVNVCRRKKQATDECHEIGAVEWAVLP